MMREKPRDLRRAQSYYKRQNGLLHSAMASHREIPRSFSVGQSAKLG
jgi:hypothetical protein